VLAQLDGANVFEARALLVRALGRRVGRRQLLQRGRHVVRDLDAALQAARHFERVGGFQGGGGGGVGGGQGGRGGKPRRGRHAAATRRQRRDARRGHPLVQALVAVDVVHVKGGGRGGTRFDDLGDV
jgi:hypothetical protein